jgi:hypothetical protein
MSIVNPMSEAVDKTARLTLSDLRDVTLRGHQSGRRSRPAGTPTQLDPGDPETTEKLLTIVDMAKARNSLIGSGWGLKFSHAAR